MNTLQLNNANLVHVTTHDRLDIFAAVGHRTIVFFDSKLQSLGRFLDANVLEKYICSVFVDDEETLQKMQIDQNKTILLAVSGDTGLVKLIDIRTGKLVQIFKGHTGSITCIISYKNYLITGSTDSSIRIWNVVDGKCLGVLGSILGHKDAILSIDIHYSGRKIITGGTDCDIKEWNISPILEGKSIFNAIPLHNYKEIHKSPITKLMYYGNLIVSLSNTNISVTASKDIVDENGWIKRNKIFQGFTQNILKIPVLLGCIELYKACKTFIIHDHNLLAVSDTGDAYLFNLKNIWEENTPCVVETKAKKVEDFVFRNNKIYITEGEMIEYYELNI